MTWYRPQSELGALIRDYVYATQVYCVEMSKYHNSDMQTYPLHEDDAMREAFERLDEFIAHNEIGTNDD